MVKTRENINEKYGGPINVKAPNLVCKIKRKRKKKTNPGKRALSM